MRNGEQLSVLFNFCLEFFVLLNNSIQLSHQYIVQCSGLPFWSPDPRSPDRSLLPHGNGPVANEVDKVLAAVTAGYPALLEAIIERVAVDNHKEKAQS